MDGAKAKSATGTSGGSRKGRPKRWRVPSGGRPGRRALSALEGPLGGSGLISPALCAPSRGPPDSP